MVKEQRRRVDSRVEKTIRTFLKTRDEKRRKKEREEGEKG